MHRRIRRAYTVLIEQGYTKIAGAIGLSDLDLIITKATSPQDVPLPERYVCDLTAILTSSPSTSQAFALSFTRRFGRTRCWRVALKCLLLLHRLLRILPSSHPFHADLLWARANSLISLNPCRFRDRSSSSSKDFTDFIKSYAHLLDEALNCYDSITSGTYTPHPPPNSTFPDRMKEVRQSLELVPQLQSLVDRATECRPAGAVARSFLVRTAMKEVARDSFACYLVARRGVGALLDCILQMPYESCIAGLEIYKKAADQAVQLAEFYQWCGRLGLCGPYEYPLVEKIPEIQVRMLEAFVEQMWHMTESSPSSSLVGSVSSSSSSSPPSTEMEGSKYSEFEKVVFSYEWEKFEEETEEEEEEEEEKPLIQFDDDDDEIDWEVLLESSVDCHWATWRVYEPWKIRLHREDHEHGAVKCERDDWKMQVCSPHTFNPFFDHGNLITL